MSELLSLDIETNWLIEDYIEKNTTGVLYGKSGCYKTFLALDWCLSIAAGKQWHGQDVNQGLVIYVAGEGNFGLQKRVKAWLAQANIDNEQIPFVATNQRVAVRNQDELEVFRDQLKQIDAPIKLIVFDTLRKCFGHGDENHSQDMGDFLDKIESIRQEFDTTCLIVHHTNKSNVIRGSNALESDVDFVFRLESKKSMSCTLHTDKMKDSEPQPAKQFELASIQVGSVKNKPVNSLALSVIEYNIDPSINAPQGVKGRVEQYILDHCIEPISWTELINMITTDFESISTGSVRTALKDLRKDGSDTLIFSKNGRQNIVQGVIHEQ
ncbi:AAA family ATPase [Marinicella rhabdoformis]|uniref:AAA family ATPase n=1 Tax=Marinicella rhabdoformis TaxID=2580566 RepID=UPI0012AEC1C9|nr:AAA family ATPase [Marinicella rhabdoformis]